ncbi:MAG: DNA replication/repair protein RecF [Bacteroidales bacterium]|jgi:DNA replication and repair protein RecF
MYLKRIILQNFKNIKVAELEFSPKINCISGNNGEGKTNLLDAIYYLSMTKSFFLSSDQYTFTYETNFTALNGTYMMDDGCEEKIAISVKKSEEKIVKRNQKQYSKLSEHIGLIPIVMVSPADTSLINDSGDERRRFMNFILSQVDKNYLLHIQAYNQILMQRNKLLKNENFSKDFLDVLSEQIVPHADYIYNARKKLCQQLIALAREYYSKLSGNKEVIELEYKSDLDAAPMNILLNREMFKDIFLKYTTVGIQRDDILFLLNGHLIRKCGSQGQQKTFLLSLKLAQYALMDRLYGITPILLLDDVFDKLDMNRVELLLSMVTSESFGQIFITDSNKVRISTIVNTFTADCANFYVENGEINRV